MTLQEAAKIAVEEEEALTICCGMPFYENSDLCRGCRDHAGAEVMFEHKNKHYFAHFHVDHPNCIEIEDAE